MRVDFVKFMYEIMPHEGAKGKREKANAFYKDSFF